VPGYLPFWTRRRAFATTYLSICHSGRSEDSPSLSALDETLRPVSLKPAGPVGRQGGFETRPYTGIPAIIGRAYELWSVTQGNSAYVAHL
jgi:hypothetical protein